MAILLRYNNKTISFFLFSIADDYEAHSTDALVDSEGFLANALNAYLLMKRFTIGWQATYDLIKNPAADSKFFKNHMRLEIIIGKLWTFH